jgi:hypothetical protein
MRSSMPVRLLASTASDPALATLCLKSAAYLPGHPCRPHIHPATASWDRPLPTSIVLIRGQPTVSALSWPHSIPIHPPR